MTSKHSLGPARALLLCLVVIVVLLRVIDAHVDRRAVWVGAYAAESTRLSVRVESVDTAVSGVRYHTTLVRTVTPDHEPRSQCTAEPGVRLRLAWPVTAVGPLPGETWEVLARIRPPSGFANPSGFDFERWLFSEGIAGTGYVREARRVALIEGHVLPQIRGEIREYLLAPAEEAAEGEKNSAPRWQNGGVLLALALADGTAVSDTQWRWFRDTGTIHLIIVTGLHIVIVAALGAIPGLLIARWVVMFRVGFPVRWCAAATGFITALGYTALTGYEVPAVRAVIFYGLGVSALVLARRLSPATLFLLALLLTLFVMPLSPLASGFWLSFVAVAVLLVAETASWRAPTRLLSTQRFVRSQLMLSVALMGWLAALLGSVSVTGPWVNLVVVPVVSVVVLPLLLLGGRWSLLLRRPRSSSFTLPTPCWG